jgi:hypothetical protein
VKIYVSFIGGKTVCSPDPARVPVGQYVTWECTATAPRRLSWRFYFTGSHPFGQHFMGSATFGGSSVQQFGPPSTVLVTTPAMMDPNDYKYGVEVSDADSGETLSDDDPYLTVF